MGDAPWRRYCCGDYKPWDCGGSGCARRCFGDACRQGGGTPRTRTAGGQGCSPLLPTMASTTPMLTPTRGALWTAREPIRRDWEDCWYSHPQASEGPKGVRVLVRKSDIIITCCPYKSCPIKK